MAIDPDASVGSPLLHCFDAAAATSGSFDKTTTHGIDVGGQGTGFSSSNHNKNFVNRFDNLKIDTAADDTRLENIDKSIVGNVGSGIHGEVRDLKNGKDWIGEDGRGKFASNPKASDPIVSDPIASNPKASDPIASRCDELQQPKLQQPET